MTDNAEPLGTLAVRDPALVSGWHGQASHLEALWANPDPEAQARKRVVVELQAAIAGAARDATDGAGLDQLLERFVAADFLDHDPRVGPGRAGLAEFLRRDGFGGEPPVLIACSAEPDHGLVSCLATVSLPDPTAPGQSYDLYICTYWRVVDGRVTEHWASGEDLYLGDGDDPDPERSAAAGAQEDR